MEEGGKKLEAEKSSSLTGAEESSKETKSILFVCYGNTCRSPMAEGLARKMLGKEYVVSSAGISPAFSGAQPDAISVMRETFGVNISTHRTRNISSLDLDRYDLIVALDLYVYETLKKRYALGEKRLILWEIEDPFGQNEEKYRNVCRKLSELIQATLCE